MQIDDAGIFARYSLGRNDYRMTLEDLRKPQIEDDDDWDAVAGRMDLSKAEFLALDRQWDHLTDPVKQGRTASALSPEPLASFRQVDEPMNLNVFAREADVQAPLAGTTPAE